MNIISYSWFYAFLGTFCYFIIDVRFVLHGSWKKQKHSDDAVSRIFSKLQRKGSSSSYAPLCPIDRFIITESSFKKFKEKFSPELLMHNRECIFFLYLTKCLTDQLMGMFLCLFMNNSCWDAQWRNIFVMGSWTTNGNSCVENHKL